jgi:hypothetical protein
MSVSAVYERAAFSPVRRYVLWYLHHSPPMRDDVQPDGAPLQHSALLPQSPSELEASLTAAQRRIGSLVASGAVEPAVVARTTDDVLELHRHGLTLQDLRLADHLVRTDGERAIDRWHHWMDDARGNGSERLTVRFGATTAAAAAMVAVGLTGTMHLLPAETLQTAIPVAGGLSVLTFLAGGALTFLQRRENSQVRYRRQLGCEYIEELLPR